MGFHWPELFAVTVVALLVFGPRRLPEIGAAVGKALREFKTTMSDAAHDADDAGRDPR
jgi:sec-independent protein translocase protein TatA